jgi:prefoldin subunit 5
VDLTTLSVQQLSEVKKQLDEGALLAKNYFNQPELEHLSQSFGQLRQARSKFLDCIKSINDGGKEEHEGTSINIINS